MDSCTCNACLNNINYEDTVIDAREQIHTRNPHAFSPKVKKYPASTVHNFIFLPNMCVMCYVCAQPLRMLLLIFSIQEYVPTHEEEKCKICRTKRAILSLPRHGTKQVAIARNQSVLKIIVNATRFYFNPFIKFHFYLLIIHQIVKKKKKDENIYRI